MHMIRSFVAILAFAGLGVASPVTADPRTLAVPVTAGWKHALTGVILMPGLAGFTRESIGDYGDGEFDIVAQYKGEGATDATIYLFHPGIDSVPVWFDRARRAIELRDIYALSPTTQPRVTAFAPPGGGVASAMRATYALGGKARFASTSLAVMPVGDWLLVVRLSSAMLNADALDARMVALTGAIGLPPGLAAAPVAALVSPCSPAKGSAKARQVAPDMMQALIMSAAAGAARKDRKPVPVYCRAAEAGVEWGEYRILDGGEGYVLALGDAGRAIGVFAQTPLMGGPQRYSLSYMGLDRTSYLPSFDRLPTPELALAAAMQGKPYVTVDTIGDGSNIVVDGGLTDKKR
jgi:hypothetical protein